MEITGITITLLATIWAAIQTFKLWHLHFEHAELQQEHSKALLALQNNKNTINKWDKEETSTPQIVSSEEQGPKPTPILASGRAYVTYIFRPLWDKDIERLERYEGMRSINVDCPKCGVTSICCTFFPILHGTGDCTGCGSKLKAEHGSLSLAD